MEPFAHDRRIGRDAHVSDVHRRQQSVRRHRDLEFSADCHGDQQATASVMAASLADVHGPDFIGGHRNRGQLLLLGASRMNMLARIVCCLLIHGVFCVGYTFLNNFAADWYISTYGGLTSRGVNIRLTSKFLYEFFLVFNAVLALIPVLRVKLILWAIWVGLILLWMLPHHPLRALLYGIGQGIFTLTAILLSTGLDGWYKRKVVGAKASKLASGADHA